MEWKEMMHNFLCSERVESAKWGKRRIHDKKQVYWLYTSKIWYLSTRMQSVTSLGKALFNIGSDSILLVKHLPVTLHVGPVYR
jgi:hypothetical protein